MTDPAYREFKFQVMAQSPEVECISLLSQVMKSYTDGAKSLTPKQVDAIAEWFKKTYSMPPMLVYKSRKSEHGVEHGK